MQTKFEVSSCTHSRNMEGVPKFKKIRSRDVDHPPLTYFCIFWFVGLKISPHTKFEVSNLVRSRDIKGVPKL